MLFAAANAAFPATIAMTVASTSWAGGVLAAILLLGGLATIVRRIVIGWSTWRHLLEVAMGGVAMGLAPLIVGQADSLATGLGQAALCGVGFAALCWWFVDPEPKLSEGPQGGPPFPPRPLPGPIWLLMAARYCAMVLLAIAFALALLISMGHEDTQVVRLLQGIGVLGVIFVAVVSVRLWLKQR